MVWSALENIPRQWIDPNTNAVLAGYWLIAFEAGTSTLTNMASDASGSNASSRYETNSNGYIVTSGGAVIRPFVEEEVKLALVPTEAEAIAGDTTNAVWPTVDNVKGINAFDGAVVADTKAALTALDATIYTTATVLGHTTKGDGGAFSAYFVSGDTTTEGAFVFADDAGTGRWFVIPKNGRYYTAVNGHIPDNTTDFQSEIQEVVDAALADTAPIVLAAGETRIGTPVNFNQAVMNISIIGETHQHATRILPKTGFVGDALFDVGDGTTLAEYLTIDRVCFRGRNEAGTELEISGVRYRKVAQFEMFNCQHESLEIGCELTTSSNVGLIAQNVFGSNNVVGIYADLLSGTRIVDNDLQENDNSLGSALDPNLMTLERVGPDIAVVGNKMNDSPGLGIEVGAFASNTSAGVNITGNTIRDTTGGMSVSEENSVITGNFVMTLKSGNSIDLAANDIACCGNAIGGTVTDVGINVNTSNCTVVGNLVKDHITAIQLFGSNNVVTGNRVRDTGTALDYGIRERSGVDNNIIVGNHVSDANTDLITRVGANSVIRDNHGFISQNSGSASITSGNTSITVSHGLDETPDVGDISITPRSLLGSATEFYFDTVTATEFTIRVDADPTQTVDFSWNAQINAGA